MNQEIKKFIRDSGVKQWQIAEYLGITEYSLSRWFRHELSKDTKKAIMEAVEQLKKGAE